MSARVAVLASGGGTNLQAILDHFAALGSRSPGTIAVVISDREAAGALVRAQNAGVAAEHVAPPEALRGRLEAHNIGVIALAGYLRLVPHDVTRAWSGRIVNVHPALLPAFGGAGMYGRRVHEAVLKAGARVTGVTVHFVDEVYDRGPIIAQWPVPVRSDDTPESLAARVLKAEHAVYPAVVEGLCSGAISLAADGTVTGRRDPHPGSAFQLVP